MSDDQNLAALLGETPITPDPRFRAEALARTIAGIARRAARRRTLQLVLVSLAVGLAFAAAQAAGISQPVLAAFGLLGSALLIAFVDLAVWRSALSPLRSPLLRA